MPGFKADLFESVGEVAVSRLEFGSGAVAMRYEPGREPLGVQGTANLAARVALLAAARYANSLRR
jgi:hypothetical protein